MDEEEIGKQVVDVAIRIHRDLGPGLMESVYEVVLEYELKQRGLAVKRQMPIPLSTVASNLGKVSGPISSLKKR